MPGMDGSETRQRLIDEHGDGAMKIVAVTASVFAHQREHYEGMGFDDFIDKPVQTRRIYSCLAELLGVEYEFAAAETEAMESETAPGWQGLSLPAELCEGLEMAVKMHSITELNKNLDALENLGAEGQRLAAHLRDLSRQYNMGAIQDVLAEIGAS